MQEVSGFLSCLLSLALRKIKKSKREGDREGERAQERKAKLVKRNRIRQVDRALRSHLLFSPLFSLRFISGCLRCKSGLSQCPKGGDLKRCIYRVFLDQPVHFFPRLLFPLPLFLSTVPDKPERSSDDCDSGHSSTGSSLERLMISGFAGRSRKDEREEYIVCSFLYTGKRENEYVCLGAI